jgi:hypothetical protein
VKRDWGGKLRNLTESLALAGQDRSGFWLLALLVIICPFYFLPAIRNPFPVGFAGLYTLMAEELVNHHFVLPLRVPFYGPGGMPFAYPPLALYLMAGVMRLTGVSAFGYLRFAPPLFTSLALIPTYRLFVKFTKSASASFVALVLVALSPIIFSYDIEAGGVVRGLAQLTAMGTLYSLFGSLRDRPPFSPIWPGVLLGLTILTHLTNALFLVVAVPLICASQTTPRNAVRACAKVFVVGLLVSAPWWLHVLINFGPSVFLNVVRSHNTLGVMSRLNEPLNLGDGMLQSMIYMFGSMPVLFLLVIPGAAVVLIQRRWLLPVWLLLSLLALSQAERLTIFVAALLAGELVAALFRNSIKNGRARVFAAIAFVILLVYNNVGAIRTIDASVAVLSQSTLEMSAWFRQNTAGTSTFIALAPTPALGEWMPYLLRRTPLIGEWGSEWLGNFNYWFDLDEQTFSCHHEQDWGCVRQLLTAGSYEPNYIIVFKEQGQDGLVADMAQRLPVVFRNSEAEVFMYTYPR